MHRPLVVCLAAFVLVSVPRFVAAQESCNRQFVVSEVSLPTTARLSQSEQAMIKARLIGRCFDDEQPNDLAGQVRGTLQKLGYLRASVSEPSITVSDASRHPQPVSLNLAVMEGARYKVREIDIIGNSMLSFEQIKSVIQIQLEDYLDGGKVQQATESVGRLYAANGYSQASIIPEVRFLTGAGVCVAFNVVEGPLSH